MVACQTNTVDFSLHCYDKSSISPELFKSKFGETKQKYRDYREIFTDGSKDGI